MKTKDKGTIKKSSGGQGLSTSSLKMSPRYSLACVSLMCEKHEKSLSDEIKTGNSSKLEKITFLFINTLQCPHFQREKNKTQRKNKKPQGQKKEQFCSKQPQPFIKIFRFSSILCDHS